MAPTENSPPTPTDPQPSQPKLLSRVRQAIRLRHMSQSTEKAYVHWIRRFILFHGKRHPAEMAEEEVNAFLTHLAVNGKVSASTQNQALSAVLPSRSSWSIGACAPRCSTPTCSTAEATASKAPSTP